VLRDAHTCLEDELKHGRVVHGLGGSFKVNVKLDFWKLGVGFSAFDRPGGIRG
jgi:hypothetical protein